MILNVLENHATCSQCGGSCCKNYPAGSTPEDWGAPNVDVMRSRLRTALDSGRYTLDCWEGDLPEFDHEPQYGQVYYVRPSIKGNEGKPLHRSYGGECTFLTPKGCEHSFTDRPALCRLLIPDPKADPESRKFDCQYPWNLGDDKTSDKLYACRLWRPYMALLEALYYERDNEIDTLLETS
jgi:hypothetical protein